MQIFKNEVQILVDGLLQTTLLRFYEVVGGFEEVGEQIMTHGTC